MSTLQSANAKPDAAVPSGRPPSHSSRSGQGKVVPAAVERQVLGAALYLARFAPDWPTRPFWMLRRCVVPYVSAGQFLLLKKDDAPAAFAGWAFERDGAPMPWRSYGYLPSAADLAQASDGGRCVVTELISPFLPPQRVLEEVMRYLALDAAPLWLELDGERKIVVNPVDVISDALSDAVSDSNPGESIR